MILKIKTQLFFCTAAMLLLFCSCNGNKKEDTNKDLLINVSEVTSAQLENNKEFSFISKPIRSSQLSFRVGGPLEKLNVYPGNYYKKGEVIARIDPRDFIIRKQKAEAVYQRAKAEYERIKILFEQDNVSASAYEKANSEYMSSKMAYESASNELNDTKLIAPFSGYVGEVFLEEYVDVKASTPVLEFVDISKLKIEAYITEELAFSKKKLNNVELIFNSIKDKTYSAKVIDISKSTTKNNLSYMLTALVPNLDNSLLSGMSGKIKLDNNSSSKKIIISQLALCHDSSNGDYVWVVDPSSSKVTRRNVKIGSLLPSDMLIIEQGLEEGEILASSNLRFLSNDTQVSYEQNINL